MRQYTCKTCKAPGHNSLTCKQQHAVNKSESKREYVCSLCKEKGHNKKTCKAKASADIPLRTYDDNLAAEIKAWRTRRVERIRRLRETIRFAQVCLKKYLET